MQLIHVGPMMIALLGTIKEESYKALDKLHQIHSTEY